MSQKNKLLIINNGQTVPTQLQSALDDLRLKSRICQPAQALEELKTNQSHLSTVILALEKHNNLESDLLKDLTEKIHSLCLNILILSDENIGHIKLDQLNGGDIYQARYDESAEMLKGRLAMLIEMQPRLRELHSELDMLRSFKDPLSNHFTKVDEEMRLAARLQRDFLPSQMPQVNNIRFATVYRPATWVSGDIYDVMRLDEHHVGFYVSDVVGHGMPAALLTMFIKQALITKRINGHDYTIIEPGEVLAQLNTEFYEQGLSDFQFATCCYGLIDTRSLKLRFANAGHPYPIHIDKDGRMRELEAVGSLLGIFDEQHYPMQTYQLNPGDKLLLYSDGMELAFANEGPDEPLRFRQEFEHLAHLDVEILCDKMVTMIEQEEGSLHPRDDVTIVGIQVVK
ncbi:MAG: serine/threonine-protein phosphatase [Sedimentisphaerales bacterium]|nr:serine/threonine-protein phosphatase [Sedimentisphaerales bacterium]